MVVYDECCVVVVCGECCVVDVCNECYGFYEYCAMGVYDECCIVVSAVLWLSMVSVVLWFLW